MQPAAVAMERAKISFQQPDGVLVVLVPKPGASLDRRAGQNAVIPCASPYGSSANKNILFQPQNISSWNGSPALMYLEGGLEADSHLLPDNCDVYILEVDKAGWLAALSDDSSRLCPSSRGSLNSSSA
jgi:hypothetical protein